MNDEPTDTSHRLRTKRLGFTRHVVHDRLADWIPQAATWVISGCSWTLEYAFYVGSGLFTIAAGTAVRAANYNILSILRSTNWILLVLGVFACIALGRQLPKQLRNIKTTTVDAGILKVKSLWASKYIKSSTRRAVLQQLVTLGEQLSDGYELAVHTLVARSECRSCKSEAWLFQTTPYVTSTATKPMIGIPDKQNRMVPATTGIIGRAIRTHDSEPVQLPKDEARRREHLIEYFGYDTQSGARQAKTDKNLSHVAQLGIDEDIVYFVLYARHKNAEELSDPSTRVRALMNKHASELTRILSRDPRVRKHLPKLATP